MIHFYATDGSRKKSQDNFKNTWRQIKMKAQPTKLMGHSKISDNGAI